MKRWMLVAMMVWAIGGARPTWADTISDSFTVFDANGNVAFSVSVSEAVEDPNEIYFLNVPGLADADNAAPTTLVEADGSYSDIFGVAYVNGDYYLAFNSDTELFPAGYGGQGVIFLPEGKGGTFDATSYLAPSYLAQGYTAQFFSDGDPAVVPEPATLTLLALGLAGLARRKAR